MLREKFPEFCSSPSPPIEGNEGVGGRSSAVPECGCLWEVRVGLRGELCVPTCPWSPLI